MRAMSFGHTRPSNGGVPAARRLPLAFGRSQAAQADNVVLRLFKPEFVLDLIERAAIVVLFVFFVHRMLPRLLSLVLIQLAHPELFLSAASINGQAFLLVVSESLAVALILARRYSSSISSHPVDWALCCVAVGFPLLATPASAGKIIPEQIATTLMLVGLVMQIAAKASLWRSFGVVPANHGVRTDGLYRVLRHPMYAGYAITHIGFLLGFPSLHNALLYAATFAIQVGRMIREEAILMQDSQYQAYAARVRHRLLPGVF